MIARDFENNMLPLRAYPLPWLTAHRAYKNRARVQHALCAYFRAGHHAEDDVSALVKARARVGFKWGLPIDDVAVSEVGTLFAGTSNASPTLFWMFCFIWSDATLVEDLRTELSAILEKRSDTGYVIDIRKFPQHCPLLVSAYQETMRLTSVHTGNRFVHSDTVLKYDGEGPDGKGARSYLLQKGYMLNMPSSIGHNAQEIWGPTAGLFDPRRFIKQGEDITKEQEKLQKKVYFPFGGGRHLCPGRHFVFAEALGTVAALVLGYDITGEDGERLKMPLMRSQRVNDGTRKPVEENGNLKIRIKRKAGLEMVQWKFVAGAKSEDSV